MPLTGLDLTLERWLLLIVWGGFVGLDGVSWLQVMISRPIVAGTVGGVLLGDAEAGFLAGAVLELLSFRHPPLGAARYPETGPAALIAGAAYASAGGEGLFPLLTVVLAGWAIGWIGARTVHWLRTLNGRLVGDVEYLAVAPRRLRRRHILAMRLDAVRASLLTAALGVPAALLARLAAGVGPGSVAGGWSPAIALVGVAALAGAGARGLGGTGQSWPLLAVGVAAAALILGVS
jgi:hypothetical protein